jgi:hypothetical protein
MIFSPGINRIVPQKTNKWSVEKVLAGGWQPATETAEILRFWRRPAYGSAALEHHIFIIAYQ